MSAQLNPAQLAPILGNDFVAELTDGVKYPVLKIGRDTWSRHEVAQLGIVQTRACSILTMICKSLDVTSTADLYKSTSPYTFAGYPAGVTTLYVMFSAFRDKGLDPRAWYRKGVDEAIVTFHTLKERERKAERRTKHEAARRRRAARNSAHRSQVAEVLATEASLTGARRD